MRTFIPLESAAASMNHSVTLKIPRRFDYGARVLFNNMFDEALSNGAPVMVITLDCAEMEYIDSAGIGLLVMAYKRAMATRTKMVMINIKPSAKDILLLANVQKLIEIQ